MKCNICNQEFDPSSLNEVFEHEHKDLTLEKDYKGRRVIHRASDVYPNANLEFLSGVRSYLKGCGYPSYPETKEFIQGYYCAERDLKDNYVLKDINR